VGFYLQPRLFTSPRTLSVWCWSRWPAHQRQQSKKEMIVDARRWPAQDGRPVGRFGYLEVVDASDVLDNAVACVVSDVHAEGKTFAQDAQLKSIAACRTIAQCLNLEHEIHDTASKLCILGFEPLK